MTFWSWSRTTATNASADSTINWAEGQAPSSVNDSARAMMTAAAKYRDDISGAIATGGTSTAYTVTSYEVFDTLAHMSGQMIAFTPHTTNAATVTLNVDGLGAKPLRTSPNVELLAGVLIQGTPYVATYNNSDASWYLKGFYGNPYNIPLGGMLDYTAATAPNSSFVLPYGQAISRSTYATLYSLIGTTYGTGDGSTTFTLPDFRGRVAIGADDMGGSAAGTMTGATRGVNGGVQSTSIAQNQLPNVALSASTSGTVTVNSTVGNVVTQAALLNLSANAGANSFVGLNAGTGAIANPLVSNGANTLTGTTSSINGGVSQSALSIVQPYLAVMKIMRVI